MISLLLLSLLLASAASLVLPSSSAPDWELVTSLEVGGVLPVAKYRSRRTGLTVLLGRAESPIVNGYFCVTTEANTNDGLPHTLEHLVFLGSESYPYKEMLDLTANRCLADRTNAWTDTDHTCYTVFTAGSGGFLNILPIYMDHILHPNLRDSDFMTEVHHISGEGEDSGVVYSEMQGVENTASNLLYFATVDELYPGPGSYKVQTGGRLKNLRENTTNAKVREYHHRYYQPRNVYITVTGHVEPEELFKALAPVEDKILAKEKEEKLQQQYERPFQTSYPPMSSNVDKTIQYPSSEEKSGRISIGRRLPFKLWDNINGTQALKLLGSYLTSTSASPLMAAFVEVPDPFATNVDMDLLMFSDPAYTVDFENVPLEKMELVEGLLDKTIAKVLADGPDKFDLSRMHTLIRRKVLGHSMNLENSPHLVIPDPAVLDMVYGHSPDDLNKFMLEGQESWAQSLLSQPATYWLSLIADTFRGPRVKVLAYPSQAFDKRLQEEEAERLQKQKEKLGPEGLAAAGAAIANAISSQKLPPPQVLESVPVADVDKIVFRKLEYYNRTTAKQPAGFDLMSMPFKFHLDDLGSKFLRYYIAFDMSEVQQSDRPYLALLAYSWLQSPLLVGGQLQNLTEVIRRRSEDTLTLSNSVGFKGSTFTPGSQSEQMMFYCETLLEKYEEAMKLLKESLYDVQFTAERINNILTQLLNSLPTFKLSAASVVSAMSDNMYFNNLTNLHHSSFLRQSKFLNKVQEQLKQDPDSLLAKLKSLSLQIAQPKNAFVYLATNLTALTARHGSKAAGLWKDFFPKDLKVASEESLDNRIDTPSEYTFANPNPQFRHAITGIPGTESCYLRQAIPFESRDWEDDEVAAARVMLQYLSDQMYVKIRGKGLTYGLVMSASITEGRILVSFTRSSQLEASYTIFRELMANYSSSSNNNNGSNWDRVLLDSARGSQIYDWAEREETVEDLSGVSMTSILRGCRDPFYNRRFVKKLAAVKMEDVRRVADKFLPRFLDANVAQTAVVCGPSEVEAVKLAFAKWGFGLNEIKDVDNSYLAD